MLNVVTPPVSRLLTTLDVARDEIAELGIDYSDSRLLRTLTRVSSAVMSALTLYPLQTVAETVAPGDAGQLVLSVLPVRAVAAISDPYAARDVADYDIDTRAGIMFPTQGANSYGPWDFGYSLDGGFVGDGYVAGGQGYAGSYSEIVHLLAPRRVSVTYTGGWVMPGQDGRDLPDDIEGVVLGLVRDAVADAGRNPTVRNETQDGAGSIQYFDQKRDTFAVPPALADLIARYAPVRF